MNFFTGLYLFLFFFGFYFIIIFLFLHHRNAKKLFSSPSFSRLPTISVLVPAYNEEKSIKDTLEALLAVDYPASKKEIIVLNDGSTDNTATIVRTFTRLHSNIILIDKQNSGKADSLNKGIARAKGELIAVVDADSYPAPDAFKKMIGHFEDPAVAAVTSRVLVKNKRGILERFQVLDYSIIAWTRKLLDFVDSVYVTNGPLSMYRRKVVTKLGGFDTRNLTEDIEITWHILSKGYRTRMSYDAVVYTTVPTTLSVWIKQSVRWNLGGLQTVQKYWKAMLRESSFGQFVIPYVSASFALALLGFLLLVRYFYIKGTYHISSLYYSLQGYHFWKYLDFSLSFSLLFFFGLLFLGLALYYYKLGFKHSQTGNKSILKILMYSFFYRSLYIIPLLLALYKLARGDIRWYTK